MSVDRIELVVGFNKEVLSDKAELDVILDSIGSVELALEPELTAEELANAEALENSLERLISLEEVDEPNEPVEEADELGTSSDLIDPVELEVQLELGVELSPEKLDKLDF